LRIITVAFFLLLASWNASASVGVSSKWNQQLVEFTRVSYLDGSLKLSTSQLRDIDCLAKAVFFEARGESFTGKKMVANVVINRTKYGKPFATNICKVVYQPNQFSWTRNKWKRNTSFKQVALKFSKLEQKSVDDSLEIAIKYVILEPKNTGISTHFSSGNVKFNRVLFIKQVGNHKFYQYLGNG